MKKKERKKMDKKLLFILILILPFLLGFRTPAGIKVIVNKGVPAQYESYWGLKWEDVDWQGIDGFFFAYGEFYQSKYPKLKINPKKLIVKIHAFDETCVDETPNSREMRTAYGCIDGLFDPYTASIHLHLGDDSVQGENSWCATALEHELKHYFLLKIHSGCWLGIDRKNSKCDQLNPSPYELGLCH